MDYFSHGLWSYIFFHKTKKVFYAVLFGLLPDTFSWTIYALYRIMNGQQLGEPNVENIPDWVFSLYNITHSLIVAGIVILLVYLILRRIPIYIFAWPIAVIIDTLTHTKDFLPTPFLWPVSNWRFPGINWADPTFSKINYTAIIAISIYILARKYFDIKK